MLRGSYLAAEPAASSHLPSTHEQPSYQQERPIRPSAAPLNMVHPCTSCLLQWIHVLCVLGSSISPTASGTIPLPVEPKSLHIPTTCGKDIDSTCHRF